MDEAKECKWVSKIPSAHVPTAKKPKKAARQLPTRKNQKPPPVAAGATRQQPPVAAGASSTKTYATMNNPQSQEEVDEIAMLDKKTRRQFNRVYSTNPETVRQRVVRALTRLSSTTIQHSVAPKNLVAKLQKIFRDDGRAAVHAYIAKHVDCLVMVKGAKMMRMNNSISKPIQSGLSKQDSSKVGVTLNLTLKSMLNNELENLEIIVRYKQRDLFALKKSGLDGACLGLFALQDFEEGDCLGFYCGNLVSGNKKMKITEYSIQTSTRPPVRWQASPEDLWMGLHFANDPHYGDYDKGIKVDGNDNCYNVEIN